MNIADGILLVKTLKNNDFENSMIYDFDKKKDKNFVIESFSILNWTYNFEYNFFLIYVPKNERLLHEPIFDIIESLENETFFAKVLNYTYIEKNVIDFVNKYQNRKDKIIEFIEGLFNIVKL